MPAPDYETIFNVEDAIEDAAKAVLQSYGIVAYTQREASEQKPQRVDIQLSVGTQGTHRKILQVSPAVTVRNSWNATLHFNIFTNRFEQNGDGTPTAVDPSVHGKLRGKVRLACEYFAEKFTELLLPYHKLRKIDGTGADPTINVADDMDVSALHYDVLIEVRDSAWPAALP